MRQKGGTGMIGNGSKKTAEKNAHPSGELDRPRSTWPGYLSMVFGSLLILGDLVFIWLFRGRLTEIGPEGLTSLWYGTGGIALLYLTAGLPAGGILLATGAARICGSGKKLWRMMLPILGIQLLYFTYHGIAAFRYNRVPFILLALMGLIITGLFVARIIVWARKRKNAAPSMVRMADLQLGGGLSFFAAAWQSCGLVGAPGFALYPELVRELGNRSFIIGQAVAVQFFFILGFAFLILSMRVRKVS